MVLDGNRLGALFASLTDEFPGGWHDQLTEVAARFGALFCSDIVTIDSTGGADADRVPRVRVGLGGPAGVELVDPVDPLGILAAAATGRPVLLDTSCALPPRLAERGVSAGVSVPLTLSDVVIVLSFYRSTNGPFTAEDVALIVLIGEHLGAVLTRAHRVAQLRRLAAYSVRVGECRGEQEVLDVAVDAILPLLGADAAGVALLTDGMVRFTTHRGLDLLDGVWSSPVEQLVAVDVVQHGAVLRSKDIRDGAADRAAWPIRAAVIVPLKVEGTVVATLGAYRYTTNEFSAEDESVLTLLAEQAGAAMANARLVETVEQRRRTAETLRGLSAALNESLSAAEVGARFCSAMLEHSGAGRVALLLLDEDQRRLVPLCTEPVECADFPHHFRGPLATIVVADNPPFATALSEQRPVLQALDPAGPDDGRWLQVQPLAARDGNVGVMLLEWDTSAPPHPPPLLDEIAAMAATALEHAQVFEGAERSRTQLAALHDVAVAINNDDTISVTLARIVDSTRTLTGAQVARIGLLDSSGATFTNVAVVGDASIPMGVSISMGHSVGAWVIQHGQSVWVPNTGAGISEPPAAAAWIHDHAPGCAVAVPIPGRGRPAIGFLTLRHSQPYFLVRSCLSILERFALEAGLAVENYRELDARRSLERQLRERASRDSLTGLANRARLREVLGQALTDAASSDAEEAVAVLFLDLDRFKTVNDSLGHAAGDELLRAVGARLSAAVGPDDVVGRLGGDEFIVVLQRLPRATAATAAERVAEQLLLSLAAPITIRARPVFTSMSIGLTVAHGSTRDAEELLRDADIAMYRAKAAGKAQIVVFEPSMNVPGLLDMESDLRQALDQQLLQVHYQPVVELDTGKTVGVEALTRWTHPVLGSIPPDEFVALAEQTGLVRRLDQWVLQTALRDIAAVHKHWPELHLNVNLSAVHLHEEALPGRIVSTLQASGVRPDLLSLEITETAAMWDPDRTMDSLTALRALGVGVVLDDFGTGYSNFRYLKRLPLFGLKIDRSFVEHVDTDPQDAAIVAAVITLSASLGLGVVAEGVETEQQRRTLLDLGCRRAQGYLFSRAVPIGALTARLHQEDRQ